MYICEKTITMTNKRKSNNPNGRPKADDKKIMIGIYVPNSMIQKHGGDVAGKKAIRGMLSTYLGLTK